MSYPTSIDTDTTPGTSIYPPQANQSPGGVTTAPTGAASPTLSVWCKGVADSLVGVETQLGLPSSPAAGSVLNTLAGKVSEAPTDGQTYVRKGSTASWVVAPAAGITDAPNDGNQYVRKSLAWTQTPAITVSHSAPSGGNNGDLWFQY